MNKSESKCILCKHYIVIPEHANGKMCVDGDGQPSGPESGTPVCMLGNYYLPAKEKDDDGAWIPNIKECAGFTDATGTPLSNALKKIIKPEITEVRTVCKHNDAIIDDKCLLCGKIMTT